MPPAMTLLTSDRASLGCERVLLSTSWVPLPALRVRPITGTRERVLPPASGGARRSVPSLSGPVKLAVLPPGVTTIIPFTSMPEPRISLEI